MFTILNGVIYFGGWPIAAINSRTPMHILERFEEEILCHTPVDFVRLITKMESELDPIELN